MKNQSESSLAGFAWRARPHFTRLANRTHRAPYTVKHKWPYPCKQPDERIFQFACTEVQPVGDLGTGADTYLSGLSNGVLVRISVAENE